MDDNELKMAVFSPDFCYFLLSTEEKSKSSSIPIHFVAYCDSPLVKVNIEGTDYVLELDLGASSNLMLRQRVLDQIVEKKSETVAKFYDIQGNQYQKAQFGMPKIQLGHLRIGNAIATEEDDFFVAIGSKPIGANQREINKQLKFLDGRIGHSLFRSTVCLLDLSRSLFCVELSLDTLKKDFPLNDYLEAPFTYEQGLLCIEFQTEKGIRKFMLDTGANRSFARKSSFPCKGRRLKINQLQLQSGELGHWNFFLLDFPESAPKVDGAFGMDFFKKFAVCIDFPNQKVYLKRTDSNFLSFLRF